MIDLNQHKLELDYPCNWKYKVVIKHDQNIEEIISQIVQKRDYKLTPSKTSSKGKFKSFNLELIVHHDDDRKGVYQLLGDHKDIKMVV